MQKQAIHAYQDYSENKFTKRVIFKHDDQVVFVLNFMPGQQLPVHQHPGSQVYLMVMNGTGTVTVDGSDTQVEHGDVIHVGGEEMLAFSNTGMEPVSLVVYLFKIPDERYARNV